jgi:DNA-binding XRE family transcriptional regulator
MQEIQNNLMQTRMSLGLSQQDVAVMLGVSRPTYVKWETNLNIMPIGKYEQLMKEFERLKELKKKEG